MRFLSRAKNEGVVVDERERIRGESVQLRVFQAQGRLNIAADLLLAENVGDVIGSERSRGIGFLDRGRNGFGSVIAYEFEKFADVACQGPVGLGEFAKVILCCRAERCAAAICANNSF